MSTIITGTGSYIPSIVKTNQSFVNNRFYSENGELIATPSEEIVEKFKDITGIAERRYADINENTSEEMLKYMVAKIPAGRLGEVDEVAEIISFMASKACSFTTGFTFDISGGRATY